MVKKIFYYIAVVCFTACLFSSCITNKQKKYLQQESRTAYEMDTFQQYKLRVNDEVTYFLMTTNLESQSLYNPSDNGISASNANVYRIYDDGTVYIPFVGQVNIAGLTIREAQALLTRKFRAMMPDAEIRLKLINNYFYVLGDGGKGQHYMYKEKINIYQAMAMAGDITSMGDKKHIKIIRKDIDGNDIIKTFDLRKESVIESEYYYVQPNDVIYIPTNPNAFFRIDSLSSFVAFFVTPLSLLFLVINSF